MFSPDHFSPLIREIMARLNGQNNASNNQKNSTNNSSAKQGNQIGGISIGPSQALVIAGIVGGVLDVTSVLVDKDQLVQIILSGSLKRKTELEKMMDQIGSLPFDEVMKAVLERFGE